MKITIVSTHKKELFEWLQENIGPVIETKQLLTIGNGWRFEERVDHQSFDKEYDIYIDDHSLAIIFRLMFI